MEHKNKFVSNYIMLFIFVSAGGAVLDIFSKYYFFSVYSHHEKHDLLPGILSVFCLRNPGIVWGLEPFVGIFSVLNIIIPIVAVFVLIYLLFSVQPRKYLFSFSLGMLMAGTVGNLFDRIFFGSVRDFIKLDFIKWPVFNIADAFICAGVALFCIILLVERPHVNQNMEKQEPHDAPAGNTNDSPTDCAV